MMKKRILTRLIPGILMAFFLVGIHEGKIALWEGDDPEPIKVFPYRASMLPKADRQRLEKGIRVETMEELTKLAEAYLS